MMERSDCDTGVEGDAEEKQKKGRGETRDEKRKTNKKKIE